MFPIAHRPLLLIAMSLVPAAALPAVYKCLDENNKIFYQDKPCRELTSADLSPALASLAPKEIRPRLLWRMNAGEKTFYVMGSLAFGSADMYPLPESVMDAFAGSKGLVVVSGLDFGEGAARSPEATSNGLYTDGSTLSAHVKPETWQRVLDLAKTLRIAEEKVASQKPWMAALTLKSAALNQAGFDDKLSVDKTFIKAGESQKPVVAIDSMENQVDRYERMTPAEQEQILLEALYEADDRNGYFKSLAEAWKNGDEDALALAQREQQASLDRHEKSLEEKRNALNQALADKIFEITADGRTQFIVVDARYLVGNHGLIAKLEEKGYRSSKL